MPCDPFQIKDASGNVVGDGFVCSRGRRKQSCRFCRTRYATKLCDRPLEGSKAGKTCDAPMCDACAKHVGPETDLCPPHARERDRSIADARAWLEEQKREDDPRELELQARAHATPIAEKVEYVKSQSQTRDHKCHWPDCKKQVPPAMWGCREHWFALPKNLRDKIWAAYRPGQEKTLSPSREYLDVAFEVEAWIRASFGGEPVRESDPGAFERAASRARARESVRVVGRPAIDPKTGKPFFCSECHQKQIETASGMTCPKGHVDARSLTEAEVWKDIGEAPDVEWGDA